MGGGPSNVSQTSTTALPAWLQPFATQFLQTYLNQVSPGNPMAAPGGAGAGSPGATQLAQFNPAMNRQVAGFTPEQMGGMQTLLGGAQGQAALAGAGAGQIGQTLGGQYLTGNPYLDAMYQNAASNVVNQYRQATAPGLTTAAEQGGVAGGSAQNQQQQFNQFGLGQNLAGLAADIYGGNYQQERQRQLQAAQLLPTAQAALTQPGMTQLGVGTLQQGQTQAGMDVATQNAISQAQWPFTLLSGLGSAIGQAGGGTGQMFATGPNPAASKGFF